MDRYLIVANQTLGGEQLERTVQDRIQQGDSHFYIMIPMTAPKHETDAGNGGPVHENMTPTEIAEATHNTEERARRHEALQAEVRKQAEQRLEQMIHKLQSAGGKATGEVGDADPAAAVKHVLHDKSFDEVIVSTLHPGVSRWLKMDLPSRVSRMTEAPVTTVEADR